MKISIQMLQNIADSALQMATAMQAIVDDCAEQLAQRKAAGETETSVWSEPFNHVDTASGQPVPAEQAVQKHSEPPLTIVELRAFVAEKSTPENRPIIKDILSQHGVKKLTELKEEQYRSVLDAVRKACK